MHIVKGERNWRFCFKNFIWEVNLGDVGFKIGFDRNMEETTFIVMLPFIYLFLTCRDWSGEDRELSLAIHSGAIWWHVWTPGESWSSETPWYRNGRFYFTDFFLGRMQYSSELIEERVVQVPMPEGCYEATIKLEKCTWKRPRWFKQVLTCIDANIPKGIPFEGKGTCSWNCGKDATYGMVCPAKSIPEGVGIIVGSVLKNRVRNGGWSDWNWTKEQVGAVK